MRPNKSVLNVVERNTGHSVPPPYINKSEACARVIAVTSGKGGVGKTNVCANIGIALANMNKKVCILDADLGLANITILIGKYPEYTIEHIISGEKEIGEVMVEGPGGIKIIPGASGIQKMIDTPPEQLENLISALKKIESDFDYILIDTSAGISSNVTSFVMSAQESIIVVSPEPTSLTDAYALIKTLSTKGYTKQAYLLVNMVLSYEDSIKIYNRINTATKKYLNMEMKYLGYIMMDQFMITSVIRQNPILILNPDSSASHGFISIAKKFESIYTRDNDGSFSEYWSALSSLVEGKEEEENREEETNKNVITSPVEIRDKMEWVKEDSLDKLADRASRLFDTNECSEEKAVYLIRLIEAAFVKTFNRPHYDLKSILYTSLDISDFSEEKIRELSLILETLYEKRFKQPLHNIHDLFIRLLEEHASEEQMVILFRTLENSFRRRFRKDILDLDERLDKQLSNDAFPEEGFLDLINKIRESHKERFGRPVNEPPSFPAGEMKDILNTMERGEKELNTLARNITDLREERKKLQARLTKIIENHTGMDNT